MIVPFMFSKNLYLTENNILLFYCQMFLVFVSFLI